jgi:hypothetical protein
VQLLQGQDCRWRGTCYHCHLDSEREAKEACWSAEERSAPRCSICGNPAVGEVGNAPRCPTCRDVYETFSCLGCGIQVTFHRKYSKAADFCSSCAMAKRLSGLSPHERQRLREAAASGTIAGLRAAREILKCDLSEAQDALAELSRTPDPG